MASKGVQVESLVYSDDKIKLVHVALDDKSAKQKDVDW